MDLDVTSKEWNVARIIVVVVTASVDQIFSQAKAPTLATPIRL
jgi:hypothetical protein